MTPEQQKAYDAALARAQAKEAERAAVPTQRLRTAAQGATLGFGDEIEARAVSLATGRPYQEVLDEVRGKVKAYQQARPGEALAYELGGAVLPALVPGGQSSLLRAGGRAALEGATYAFGTGEGGFGERAARVPAGAIGGAAGGALGYSAVKGAARLMSAANRAVGRRGATIVNREIQRLVQQTGRSADEVAQDIIDGRLLAENKTIQAAVRALRAGGGEASTIIQQGLETRPAETRAALMDEMRKYLGGGGAGSQVAQRRASDEATDEAIKQAYAKVTTPLDPPAPPALEAAVKDALERVPTANESLTASLRARTKASPFYTIEDGQVTFARTPTVMEAERVRRALAQRATALYRAGEGDAAEAISDVEKALRAQIDTNAGRVKEARTLTAQIKADRDAYKAGTKAFTGDINERIADFDALRLDKPEAVEAYRQGAMQAIEAFMRTGSRSTFVAKLTDPEHKYGAVVRAIFPEDQLEDLLRTADIAEGAQTAAGKILIGTGSQTTETAQEAARQGMGFGAADALQIAGGDPAALLAVAGRIMRATAPQLSDADRAAVAKILVSRDPELVRRALTDRTAAERLTQLAAQISRSGGAQAGAQAGQYLTGPQ